MDKAERRSARRLKVEIPTLVEAIPAHEQTLPPELVAVYERVEPAREYLGRPTMLTVRDVSSNGAFLEGPALPLLSRVRFRLPFSATGGGESEALGWVMWRRTAACTVGGVTLEPGIGILFEAFPLEARVEIARLAREGG